MFEGMIQAIQEEVVRGVYQVRVAAPPRRRAVAGPVAAIRPRLDVGNGGAERERRESPQDETAPAKRQPITVAKKVGRNQPCPCGSGKKYKKCCGA
ncbi:MAG: hypothetical protein GYA84_04555 [Firmicutes bacterium]|nr:hypothetical protein [Bacillota bacterium]